MSTIFCNDLIFHKFQSYVKVNHVFQHHKLKNVSKLLIHIYQYFQNQYRYIYFYINIILLHIYQFLLKIKLFWTKHNIILLFLVEQYSIKTHLIISLHNNTALYPLLGFLMYTRVLGILETKCWLILGHLLCTTGNNFLHIHCGI